VVKKMAASWTDEEIYVIYTPILTSFASVSDCEREQTALSRHVRKRQGRAKEAVREQRGAEREQRGAERE
jgi:hypothetical protein